MIDITSTKNDDLYRALDAFFTLAQGFKSETTVPIAKVQKTSIYPIFHEDYSRYISWEKTQSKGAESRITFLKAIQTALRSGFEPRSDELGKIIRYCESKGFDFEVLFGLLDGQITKLVSFESARIVKKLRDENPEHFDLDVTIKKIKRATTDSVAEAVESLQALSEFNSISHQQTVLMGNRFDTKSLYITRDAETKLFSQLRELDEPMFLSGNAGTGKSMILANLNDRLKSSGKLVFYLTIDDIIVASTQESIAELSRSAAACSELVILVDGIDRRLHEPASRQMIMQLHQLSEDKQFGLLLSCRNLERERYFPDAKTQHLSPEYSYSEFYRAYFAFCDTVFSYRTELTNENFDILRTSIAERLPIGSLAKNPLYLRFILEAFSSQRIRPEITSIELFTLFWKSSVCSEGQSYSTSGDPHRRDLTECALALAERCLEKSKTSWDARDLDAMLLMGRVLQTDFDQLMSEGIVLLNTDFYGTQRYAFFHQTILEYACALSILRSNEAREKSKEILGRVQGANFSTYHLPIFRKLVQLACVTFSETQGHIWDAVEEALVRSTPHLVTIAVEAFSLSAELRSEKQIAFRKILKDRFLAARFIQNSNNLKPEELKWLWQLFADLWHFEREMNLDQKPNVVRTAILKELSSLAFRDIRLSEAQIYFFWAEQLYREIPKQEIFYLCDTLVIFVRIDRSNRFNYFVDLIQFLAENAGNQNNALYRIAYRIRSVKPISIGQGSQVKEILSGVDDIKLRKIAPLAEAWSWPAEAPPPYAPTFRELLSTEPHLNILHEWSLDQSKEELANIWRVFVDDIFASPISGTEPHLWVRIIWDRLGKELYEQDGLSSEVGYDFLVEAISDGLLGNSSEAFAAANFICSETRNLDLLIGVFGLAKEKILASDGLSLIFASAIAQETGQVEFGHIKIDEFSRKQLRRVTSNIAPLTQKWPKLQNQLLNLSISLGDFPAMFNDIYEGRITISEFLPSQKSILEEQVVQLLRSEKSDEVQRGARTIALQSRLPERLSIEQGLIASALSRAKDQQEIDWLCVAGYLSGLDQNGRTRFDTEMLRVVASGNEFVSPKATPILVETALAHKGRFERSEVFASLESNVDGRKARWYLSFCFGLAAEERELAQSKVLMFFYGDTFRKLGTAQTATIRRVVRVPFANWLSRQAQDFALGLIKGIESVPSDFAILIGDGCLNSSHFIAVSEEIQPKLTKGGLELGAAQKISEILVKKFSGATTTASAFLKDS